MEKTFSEIIEMMADAEDYGELYNAASYIKNDDLRVDVEQMIGEYEDTDTDVDVAYSCVTSDLLDMYMYDDNTEELEGYTPFFPRTEGKKESKELSPEDEEYFNDEIDKIARDEADQISNGGVPMPTDKVEKEIDSINEGKLVESNNKLNAAAICDWVKKSIDVLVENDEGCCEYPLDNDLSIFCGWQDGYDPEDTDGVHSKSEPSWCVTVGIKSNHEYMKTDFDWLTAPYDEETGEVWNTDMSVGKNGITEYDAQWYIEQYNEIKKALESGEIVLESKKITEGKDRDPLERKILEYCVANGGSATLRDLCDAGIFPKDDDIFEDDEIFLDPILKLLEDMNGNSIILIEEGEDVLDIEICVITDEGVNDDIKGMDKLVTDLYDKDGVSGISESKKITEDIVEGDNTMKASEFASTLQSILNDNGFEVDARKFDDLINITATKNNISVGAGVYFDDSDDMYNGKPYIGIGGDCAGDTAYPVLRNGWEAETATPVGEGVNGTEVYAMFNSLEHTSIEEVVSIMEEAINTYGTHDDEKSVRVPFAKDDPMANGYNPNKTIFADESKKITEGAEFENSSEENLATYIFNEAMEYTVIDRDGYVKDLYIPELEEIHNYYDEDVTEETYNKVVKIVSDAINHCKYYKDSEGSGVYIELNDNRTMWDIDIPEGFEDDSFWGDTYSMMVRDAAEDFESRTGVYLRLVGRSGRHACVDVSLENAMRYDELKSVQEELEKEVIQKSEDTIKSNLGESKKMTEGNEIKDEIYDVANVVADKVRQTGSEKISMEELNDIVSTTCAEKGIKEYDDLDADIRGILSYMGFETDFESGDLMVMEEGKKVTENTISYGDDGYPTHMPQSIKDLYNRAENEDISTDEIESALVKCSEDDIAKLAAGMLSNIMDRGFDELVEYLQSYFDNSDLAYFVKELIGEDFYNNH